jgi:4-amino-4-deoxy-L-arabinose transferase-like glycosyltransferase
MISEKQSPARDHLFLHIVLIAIFAVALRLAYQAGMVHFGGSFNNGSDSEKYLAIVRWLLGHGMALQPDTERTPFYTYFIAALFGIFQSENLRIIATAQAVLDGVTVIAIAYTAKALSSSLAIPAAIVAAVIPNFVVQSAFVLQESLFMVFFCWGLCALFWAVRSERTLSLLLIAGVLFAAAVWTRLVVLYFAIFMLPALIYALRSSRGYGWVRCGLYSLIPLAMLWAATVPFSLNNYIQYGYFTVSSQPGGHLLFWFYGCLSTPWPCANRSPVHAMFDPIVAQQMQALGPGKDNVFAESAILTKLFFEQMVKLPVHQIVFGMAWGAFRNLMQTGFYQVLTQFNQPLNFFSVIRGDTILQRGVNFFIVNQANYFMILWGISQLTLVISRVVQLVGLFEGLRRRELRGPTVMLLSIVLYFAAINGPIADPRYRIPAEPALIILLALGLTHGPLPRLTSVRRLRRGNPPTVNQNAGPV